MRKIFVALFVSTVIFLSCKQDTTPIPTAEKEISFNLPDNFVLEDLYQPSENEQGSWVAMARGPKNTIFACDQYGEIYYFNTPEINQTLQAKDVKPLNLKIGEAHGLHWAHNSLYVAVNKRWQDDVPDEQETGSGIYRITDNNHDGQLDKVEILLKLDGAGEHGPHSFVSSPDGSEIYFIAGNHTLIPEKVKEHSRLPINWGEDNLFEPYLDARGHANDIKAPGGWVCKFNPDGTEWELISVGYRNPFDIAFNKDGELFTYDADMEWDIGMPWYRPTRICHVTSGSEYGWRTGSGKWPDYYPDALPAVHNLEQGSPTAVLSGAALDFPSSYKNGLFVMDWSFGTLYYADLLPKGSSYSAERKEFISGTPLPLTDMIAGADGHLYFASGGRRINSHLFRLRYVGADSKEAKEEVDQKAEELRKLRQNLEEYHSKQSPKAIPLAWNNLDHEDRFIRYAARIALEQQPTSQWFPKFIAEKESKKIIEASIALARQGDKSMQSKILKKLQPITLETQLAEQQLNMLRSYELNFIRMGEPSRTDKIATAKKLNAYFPHASDKMNRELGQLLLYLDAPGITEKLVALLEKHTQEGTTLSKDFLSEEITKRSEQYGPLIREILDKMPPSEAIYYGVLLSHADKGWTKESRSTYFNWFYDVLNAKGGLSFKPGMENIRLAAMKNVPENEKEYFQEMSGVYSPETAVADLPQPIGPGHQYGGREIGNMVWGDELAAYQVDYKKGKRAFQAGMCILCHRIKGEGAAIGPDLTQAHTKFNNYEMLFATYSPNDEISDQYANTLFHLKGGKKISGRIKSENDEKIILMPNPFNESYTVEVAKNELVKKEPSPLSPMPSGLLNRLNPKEIKDLFAYIQAGGDPNHEVYKKEHPNEKPLTFTTPLGKKYTIAKPSEKLLTAYNDAKQKYESNPNDVEALIWYGRRTAYLGRYDDAIAIYTKGIKEYPNEARLYRHRGHRYISIREFDNAITDLKKATVLIKNKKNEIEPDGMPNAQNIPVSTLHGNIWYHLGLAYYLKHNYNKAFDAYIKCRESGKLPDNIVSSTHWLYMIQRRLGNQELAEKMLEPITLKMNIIENQSYYQLCKFYKGLLPIDSLLQTKTGSPSNDAITYGVANWYFYNNKKDKAKEFMKSILESKSWSSFGYIAAESDFIRYY